MVRWWLLSAVGGLVFLVFTALSIGLVLCYIRPRLQRRRQAPPREVPPCEAKSPSSAKTPLSSGAPSVTATSTAAGTPPSTSAARKSVVAAPAPAAAAAPTVVSAAAPPAAASSPNRFPSLSFPAYQDGASSPPARSAQDSGDGCDTLQLDLDGIERLRKLQNPETSMPEFGKFVEGSLASSSDDP